MRPKLVVGIDLGTTHSLIAVVQNNAPVIIPTREGQRLLPSIVGFNSEITTGFAAKKERTKVSSFKRLLGHSQQELEDLPLELRELPTNQNSQKDLPVQVKLGEQWLTPIELSSIILKELRLSAETFLGGPVKHAVISVPAYFNDAQRQATRVAGECAGLEVLRVINEPTAAALAYGFGTQNPSKKIAVYDLGGGTFDVSLLKLENGIYEVLATRGDTHLGGDDLDLALAQGILRQENLELASLSPQDFQVLLEEAQKLKIASGTHQVIKVHFECSGRLIDQTWSQQHCFELMRPLIERTRQVCEQALMDAKLEKKDLEEILLVGGSTRLSLVQEIVEEIFNQKPSQKLHPDEVVAAGAAILGGILSGQVQSSLLLDVVPLSLGIETYGGLVSVLIPRNSKIPYQAKEIFTTFMDYQTGVDLHIVQGEQELAQNNRSLGRFKLNLDQILPAGMVRVEVCFAVDADGILQVKAQDLKTKEPLVVEVQPSFGMSPSQVQELIAQSKGPSQKNRIRAELEATSLLRHCEKALERFSGVLTYPEKETLEVTLQKTRIALKNSELSELESNILALQKASEPLAEKMVNKSL